jgi:four helix bundle protein
MQEKKKVQSHKDLIVWQKAYKLALLVYTLTTQLPSSENFGLKSQAQRSATSIPSNIAEGFGRGSKKYFKHFLSIALGSACELETQLLIIHDQYNVSVDSESVLLEEIIKMLKSLIKKLQ